MESEIAVVGMACRFPHAADLAQFWSRLCEGHDAIEEIPDSRFSVADFYDPRPGTAGKIVSRQGGFLDGIDQFDSGFFGIAPREADRMDPQQRLLMEVAQAAIDDAGVTRDGLAGSRAGVFMGSIASNYWEILNRSGVLDLHANSGTARSLLSGRLSYFFDLRGPSLTVDTACSSSLNAVHLACQSLRRGESSLALAGGTNLILAPGESITFSSGNMLSPDGRCKFASADANGFVRSEGVGVVVLKRLRDAVADGDAIRAVILGSATVNDGQASVGMMAPSREAQEQVLRAACSDAGVRPEDVAYIEAHGTGTGVGDPVELNALAAVFGRDRPAERPVLVGSVKTNIGHTEAAAGIAGLIKTVLCLEHGLIPASLHSGDLTSAVDWGNLPLRVPQELRELPQGNRPVVAGVSSFGISGTNVHVVVGQHHAAARPAENERPPEEERQPEDERCPRLLSISSHDPAALRDLAGSYARYLEPGGDGARESLRDICFSAATRRQSQDNRLTVVGETHEEMAGKLRAFLAGDPAPFLRTADEVFPRRSAIVFVFPGQGSQWIGMGRELARGNPAFRDALAECDAAVRAETGWSVTERLASGAALEGADVIQPTLWATEVALAAAWRSAGIEPDLVVGHSMGEVAAACVAGSLSVRDAAAVICRRSALAMEVSGRGAMASVELSADEVAEELEDYAGLVSIAAMNGPSSTVLSGDAQAMRELLASFTERGVFCRLVQVDFASHSPQVDPLREPLRCKLQSVSPRPGKIPMYSTVLEEPVTGQSLDAGYWVRNLRDPVRFGPVIEQLVKNGPATFIEVSPHPILVPAVREYTDKADAAAVVGSTRRNEPELSGLLDSAGAVWLSGHPVDLGHLFEDDSAYVRLPAQAWSRRKHWFPEPAQGRAGGTRAAGSRPAGSAHPLLGAKLPGDGHVWEGPLDLSVNAYLNDHQVQGVPIVPGTAYIEMAAAAAASAFGSVPEMRDVTYREAIFLTGSLPPVIRIAIEREGEHEQAPWRFTISSRPGDQPEFTLNADGRFERGEDTGPGDAGTIRPPKDNINGRENINGEDFYRRFEAKGNQWRGAFRGVRQLWLGQAEAVAQVEAPEAIAGQSASHHFHPALLDACGHVLAAVTGDDLTSSQHDAFVLGSIDRVRLHKPPRGPVRAYATRTDSRPEHVTGDVEVRDEAGTLLAEMRGVRLRYLVPREKRRDAGEWIHGVEWRRAALTGAPGPAPAGCWLLFADDGGTAEAVARRLGGRVVLVTPGDSYGRTGADRYELAPDAADGYRALLADLRPELGEDTSVGVVHLWSLDGTDDEGGTQAMRLGCHSVLHLAQALDGAPWPRDVRLWLVTAGGQYLPGHDQRVSPGQALLWGFGRALAQEYREWRCSLIDLPLGTGGPRADLLSAELLSGGDGENQVALRDGRYAARLVRHRPVAAVAADGPPAPAVGTTSPGSPGGAPARFEIRSRAVGSLDALGLCAAESRSPGRGEVGIQVDGAALNYRDVLMAMGAYPGQGDHPRLGWECAGTVADIGDGVAGLRRGDRVVAVAEGALASYAVARARLVAPIPARLTADEALTVPAAYLTAYYGLVELANLAAGERVLIHSASGGVGLAALHIARWRGAEVYATAGSPQKRAFLKTLGVEHVADSRSLDFASSVMAATRGEGVDVVLNSLAGEAIPANLSLLAPYGRYVELSKKDLLENRGIGLLPFSKNLSLHSVDLVDLFQERPGKAGELLMRIFGLLEAGLIQPLPYETYDVAEASEAFRQMARSRHIGKVLIRFTEPSRTGPSPAGPRETEPAAEEWNASGGTCLITGGLGGIGLALAAWLAGRGTRDLLLVGRRPLEDQPAAQREALRDLQRAGVTVTYRAADVADERAMKTVLDEHEHGGHPPVTGVMHAAGVLDLAPVAELRTEQLDAMVRPKINGAWTLHRVLGNRPLDFFVLFSSASAVLGSPQLAAYAAANAALDAFALYRRASGLPALSVNWGFWSSVGMVARYAEQHGRTLAPKGIGTFTPQEGTEVLERLLRAGSSQAAVLPADWNRWAEAYPDAAREPLLRDLVAGRRPPDPPGPPVVKEAKEPPEAKETQAGGDPDVLREFLTRLTAKVLGLPPDRLSVRKPLNRQGLDSLMATEIRSEIHREYGLMVPMAKMIGGQSLAELADYLAQEAGREARALPGRVGPDVLEDQRCLGVGDVRVGAQRLHQQAQVLGGRGRDVQQEVVLPGQEEDVQHLGQARHPPHECPDVPARVRLQPDGDHGLQGAAERRGVDVRVVSAYDALLAQGADPSQARRRGDADAAGEGVVGQPGVARQLADDRAVCFIQVKGPNRLQGSAPRAARM